MFLRSNPFIFLGCAALAVAALDARAYRVDVVCPCVVEQKGGSMTVTFGLFNLDQEEAVAEDTLAFEIAVLFLWPDGSPRTIDGIAVGEISAAIPPNSELARASYTVESYASESSREWIILGWWKEGQEVELELHLQKKDEGRYDFVTMSTVDPLEDFVAKDLDLLADEDGDGVGDLNEQLVGTDPQDRTSTPADESIIDLLVLYSKGFYDLYQGDPHTRIHHLIAVASEVFTRSNTGIKLRVVGRVEAELVSDWQLYSTPELAFLRNISKTYGADTVLMLTPYGSDTALCGWAALGGARTRGQLRLADEGGYDLGFANVQGECSGTVVAHELGHVFGLAHSFRQHEAGTFRWSRGHYVDENDGLGIGGNGTVMSYGTGPYWDRFSDPDRECGDFACGVPHTDPVKGADAVKSLRTVRFQLAARGEAKPDTDGDGWVDPLDDAPNDPSIWWDTDGDGVNNEDDRDDDNDGFADVVDDFPLDGDDWQDFDGDGVGDNTDAFPEDPAESRDSNGDGIGDNASHPVPLFLAAGDGSRSGFVRIVNRSDAGGEVVVYATDDAGRAAGPVTLRLGPNEGKHFNSDDLEKGNPRKGLEGAAGDGTGDWHLVVASRLDLDVMAYGRTEGGFLNALHDVAKQRERGGPHRVVFFNPASNRNQRSLLRIVNPGAEPAAVSIQGTDDKGVSSAGAVQVSVPARGARVLTAPDLESGSDSTIGALGDGRGKWRLDVRSDNQIMVVSLLESPTGHLTNLSTAPYIALPWVEFGQHVLPLFSLGASLDDRSFVQGFIRVVNTDVALTGLYMNMFEDDEPGGYFAAITAGPYSNEVRSFNYDDVKSANPDKGFDPLGAYMDGGAPKWLGIWSTHQVQVLGYARTSDGFVTTMHDHAPSTGGCGATIGGCELHYDIAIFNPGSNKNQRSYLRLINTNPSSVDVTITPTDDSGRIGGVVRVNLPGKTARMLASADLESGDAPGLHGAFGDGEGKWRLALETNGSIAVASLLRNPTGHWANLSTIPGNEGYTWVNVDGIVTHPH